MMRCKNCGKPGPGEYCNEACAVDWERMHAQLCSGDIIARYPHHFDDSGRVVVNSTSPTESAGRSQEERNKERRLRRESASRLYQGGATVAGLAARFDIEGDTVKNWLRREGVFKPSRVYLCESDRRGFAQRYRAGESDGALAGEAGVKPTTILSWATRFEPLSKGE